MVKFSAFCYRTYVLFLVEWGMDIPSSFRAGPRTPRSGFEDLIDALEKIENGFESLDFSSEGLRLLDGKQLLAVIELSEKVGQFGDVLRVRVAARVNDVCRGPVEPDSITARLGVKGPIDLLQQVTGLSAGTLRKRVALGQRTATAFSLTGAKLDAQYPAIAAGIDSGALSVEASELIVRTLDDSALRSAAAPEEILQAEITLVEAATGTGADGGLAFDTDSLRILCKRMSMLLDQDGARPNESGLHKDRELYLSKERRGLVGLTGYLTPDIAALLSRLLDAANSPRVPLNMFDPDLTGNEENWLCPKHKSSSDPEFSGDSNADLSISIKSIADATLGGEVTAAETEAAAAARRRCQDCAGLKAELLGALDDLRSPKAKRHDAFAALLGVTARHPDTPLVGGAPVTVLVQTTQQDLETSLRRSQDELSDLGYSSAAGHRASERPTTAGSRHVTKTNEPYPYAFLHDHHGSIVPVNMDMVRQASCSGSMQRITLTDVGGISQIETPQRVFNPNQRKAIILRDGGCAIPGCTVPPTWCEVHHVTPWAIGGRTSVDNGVILCYAHHRDIDTSGWAIKMVDKVPYVRAPK